MEKGPIQVKMKLTILTMMVIIIMDHIAEVMRSSFRKHQRLTMVDHALRDMWAPFSEPCGLSLDRSGRTPLSAQMEHGHGGGWAV